MNTELTIHDGILEKCVSDEEIVRLPEGITRIDRMAFFSCIEIKEIILPDGLQEIGGGAFKNCEKLESVLLPQSLTKIENSAFESCHKLKNITLSDGIKKIGASVFAACRSLESIRIPNTIKKLPVGIFSGCKALKSVSLPDGMQEIGKTAFGGCSSLINIDIPDSVTSIGERGFYGCTALRQVKLSKNIESVGEDAFSNCDKELDIYCSTKIFTMLSKENKDNMAKKWLSGKAEYDKNQTGAIKKYVGRTMDRLFTEMEGDDEESLSKLLSCGKIKPEALDSYIKKCNDGKHPKMMAVLLSYKDENVSPEKKEELTDKELGIVEINSKDLAERYRWVQEADGITITKYKGIDADTEIPSHIDGVAVVRIGKNAFKGNTQINTVRLPDTVIEIGESAFEKCPSLSSVEWSSELRVIEKRAFYSCESMEGALILPPRLKHIGVNAFYDCPFTQLSLPDGIETIATGALDGCDIAEYHIPASVKELGFFCGYFDGDVYIYGKDTKIEKNKFHGMPTVIHAPKGSYVAECAEEGAIESFVPMEE